MNSVAVVIPTLNAERWLPALFGALAMQQPRPPEEIILVDSGSTDDTVSLALAHPGVRLINIETFTHGGSRNTGIRAARSDIVVLMTQDAAPADADWLARLIAPLDEPAVAGVYSRQIPRPDASPMEQFFLMDRFPPGERVIRRHRGSGPPVYPQTFFSNVSSAARRETWLKFPFDETLLMSEDQQFARDTLIAGLSIVYEPCSLVVHSHNYTLTQTFKRYFDSVVAFQQVTPGHTLGNSIRLGEGKVYEECFFVACHYPVWLPYFFCQQAMKAAGAVAGQCADRMTNAWCTKCSLHPGWWQIRKAPRS